VGRDAKPTAILKLAERGEPSRTATAFRSKAVDQFMANARDRPADVALRGDRHHVLDVYRAAAIELASSPDKGARTLAVQLARFAQDMPRAETRLSATLRAMKEIAAIDRQVGISTESRGKGRDRER
jgi:hypothetical protein